MAPAAPVGRPWSAEAPDQAVVPARPRDPGARDARPVLGPQLRSALPSTAAPSATSLVDSVLERVAAVMAASEARILGRFDALERRVAALEDKVSRKG